MSMALTVFLEDRAGNLAGMIDPNRAGISYGYEITHYFEFLDKLATDLGCQSLSPFVYEDPELVEEALEAAGNEMDEETFEGLSQRLEAAKQQEQWHEPGEALNTIHRFINHLQNHPNFADAYEGLANDIDALIWDLETVEGFLTKALEEGRRFCFHII
jgi:hypothetical protein